ncbi:MAG: hypothetical protein WCG92_05680 [Hyphomicrobiales bacterium]|nr:hypothetical protein [Alphaproteobacteria bacterium]
MSIVVFVLALSCIVVLFASLAFSAYWVARRLLSRLMGLLNVKESPKRYVGQRPKAVDL